MNEVNDPASAEVTSIDTARQWRASGKQSRAEREIAEREALRMEYANWLGMAPEKYAIVEQAAKIIAEHQAYRSTVSLRSPKEVRMYLKARIGARANEVFLVLFLDNRGRVMGIEEMFHGTLAEAKVHTREVVREALRYNAKSVIFAHNHPHGNGNPSPADRSITRDLRDALDLIGVNVLDHFIVGDGEPTSMAERALI